jgi:hypothetical protein
MSITNKLQARLIILFICIKDSKLHFNHMNWI